jgi:SET domain-containing protein
MATVKALRRIEVGEEICISYVKETLEFSERSPLIEKSYAFICGCPKCKAHL